MIKRIMSFILVLIMSLIMCLDRSLIASAAVNNKTTEHIANLIYFVDFKDSDSNFMDGKVEKVKNMFDGDKDSSLSNYIKTISYNQMNVHNYFPQESGGKIIPYTLPNTRSYYNKTNEEELITTVLSNVAVDKNYNLDMNNDGYVDNVIFIFAAKKGEDGDVLWAHKANHNGATEVNGKKVDNYNIHNSYNLMDSLASSEEGVLIHEFMHSIGYPDLYRSSGSGAPVGRWDIMSSVSSFVQYPLSYLRSEISNWISIDTVTESGTYKLKPSSNSGDNQALILKTPISEKEFFVVEYRKRGNPYIGELDGKIPGDGLIIYRVNTEETSNYHGEKDYIYVFRPGETGEGDGNGNLSEAFLSKESGRTTYGSDDFSKTIVDKAITYSNGQNSGIVIENVLNAGEEITFDIKFTDTTNLNIWDVVGNKEVSNRTNNDIDMDVVGDKVYTVYNEDNKLKAKMFDGSNWTSLGECIINKRGSNPTIKVHNGIAYVLYHDSNYRSVVARFVNNNWETVQTLTSDTSQYSDMISTNDGIYVAITNGKTSVMNEGTAYLKVLKLNENTNTFEQIGGNLHTGHVVEPSLTESNGNIYVSYTDFQLGNKVFIKKYENSTWKDVDGINLSASRASIKATNNKLYLATTSVVGKNTSEVYVYENNKWTKIGDDVGGSEVGDLVIDINNNTPYVAYADNNNGCSIVKKLEGDKWVQEGSNVSDERISKLAFKISNNKAYVAINPITSQKLLIKSRELERSNEEDKEEIVNVSEVTLNKSELSLVKGASEVLLATVTPANATNKELEWTSSDSSVARVDLTGKITAVSAGTATIMVKTKDGAKVATCKVIVKDSEIQYRTHVQDYGWQEWKSNGEMSGTSGESKRLEGIEIKINDIVPGASIKYRTHVQDYGWQEWKSNGEMSGTSGESKRLEGIEIKLENAPGYSIEYRTHVQDYGWQEWKRNGEMSGTSGESKRLEGIEIRIVKDPEIQYRTHVQDYGWQEWKNNGEMSGTSGESKRLEGIEIKADNLPKGASIQYRTHVQDYGWQEWKSNGEMSGTSGESKRLEGIEIKLENAPGYSIEYRTHVQDYGWQEWKSNGEMSGTSGESKRLEGIEIRIVKK